MLTFREATTALVTQVTQGMALVSVQVCDKYTFRFISKPIGDKIFKITDIDECLYVYRY